jgi:membrane-bound lytic murein transglycosylase MltF
VKSDYHRRVLQRVRTPVVVLAAAAAAAGCSRGPAEVPSPSATPAAAADATRPETPAAVEPPAGEPSGEGPSLVLPDEFEAVVRARKYDLDAMVERRMIRMLVTYSSTSYFVDRGRQGGMSYDAARLLEDELNRQFKTGTRKMHVVMVPVTRDQLLPALVAGQGDIAAANLTITPARLAQVAFSVPVLSGTKEVVVTGPGAPPVARLEDLAGREVHVRASSSFAESLADLNRRFAKSGLPPVRVVPVDERLETEDILEMANAGVFPVTIADDYLARLWAQVFTGLQVHDDVAVREGGEVGWAMRKESPKLKQFVDEFARKNRVGTRMGNIVTRRYLGSADWIKSPDNEQDMARFRSMVGLFRKYGEQYDFDYLMVTAQAYQESGLDQSRKSRVGAVGVMQILPSTAGDPNVDVRDVQLLENNIHAGVKYLRFVVDRYFSDLDHVNRQLFAFAAYNAGPARVAGLREKARRMRLDPDRWFANVEVVAAREIGRETVQYVANIFKYYLAYKLVTERAREKAEAKRAPAAPR